MCPNINIEVVVNEGKMAIEKSETKQGWGGGRRGEKAILSSAGFITRSLI